MMNEHKQILTFLQQLERNNKQAWFHEHKPERMEATRAFETIVEDVMMQIHAFDDTIELSDPKRLIGRLNRDTRFSKDKSPYNPAFTAHISANGKLPIPVGYFICLRPNDSSIVGGGLFTDVFKDATKRIRDHIASNGERFQSILQEPAFTEKFTLLGSSLKKVPAGYDPAHPQADYLKYKSWFIECAMEDTLVMDREELIKTVVDLSKRMKPFNDFLNEALQGFVFPER